MALTKWVYTYDDKGNRTGLAEVPVNDDTEDTIADKTRQWDKVEQSFIDRSRAMRHRYEQSFRERAIADTERKILQERKKTGYCPAHYEERVRFKYQTASGNWKDVYEVIVKQNTSYIIAELQDRLATWGVHHMTGRDIQETLEVVSACYWSADVRALPRPIVKTGKIKQST